MEEIIGSLRRTKAADIHGIPPCMIRDLAPILAPLLTRIFNQSISLGTYPDALKLTKVVAAYKGKGASRSNVASYRPISLVPILAKCLDRMLNRQLMSYLLSKHLLAPKQYAFRPGSSTIRALENIYSSLLKGKNSRSAVILVSTDLSKAYDTVDHTRLLQKLKSQFHMSDKALALLRAYITDRSLSTHIGDTSSTLRLLSHGIPQGSSLSTTLFIMYVNDLFQTTHNTNIVAFADDNTLILAANDPRALLALAKADFSCVTDYMLENRLALHPTKTKYMILNAPALHSVPLCVGTQPITKSTSVRTLGVILDQKMRHSTTVGLRIQSLQPIVKQLSYARQFLTTPELKHLYLEQAYPRLTHSITIWGHETPKGYLRPLIKIQKRLVRAIAKVGYRTPTRNLFTELNFLTVPYLFILRVCTEMHPFITQRSAGVEVNAGHIHHIHHYQPAGAHHRYPSRHAAAEHKLRITRGMDPLAKRYATIWNNIPGTIRSITHIKQFSAMLKLDLINKQSIDRRVFTN